MGRTAPSARVGSGRARCVRRVLRRRPVAGYRSGDVGQAGRGRDHLTRRRDGAEPVRPAADDRSPGQPPGHQLHRGRSAVPDRRTAGAGGDPGPVGGPAGRCAGRRGRGRAPRRPVAAAGAARRGRRAGRPAGPLDRTGRPPGRSAGAAGRWWSGRWPDMPGTVTPRRRSRWSPTVCARSGWTRSPPWAPRWSPVGWSGWPTRPARTNRGSPERCWRGRSPPSPRAWPGWSGRRPRWPANGPSRAPSRAWTTCRPGRCRWPPRMV